MNRNLIYFLFFLLISVEGFAQLNLNQLTGFMLGVELWRSQEHILSVFSKPAEIEKADFLGATRIEFDDVPFDYYGNGDYCFQYVKDTLVAIKIEYKFYAGDSLKIERLLKTAINDINQDKSGKRLLTKYTTLDEKSAMRYIRKECVLNTAKDSPTYKPIKMKYLGRMVWGLYDDDKFYGRNNSWFNGNFLTLSVDLGESHRSHYEKNNLIDYYNGCYVTVTFEHSNERLQDLKLQEESMRTSSYKNVPEKTEKSEKLEIKLKLQGGVYTIPVKLNNTISIDFVLDPGAADVAISPDVFLVLLKAGTIEDSDYIGSQTYQFADGSTAKSNVFNIKTIQIGDQELSNVRASISNSLSAPLLLGQSALKKLKSYKIDVENKLFIIE